MAEVLPGATVYACIVTDCWESWVLSTHATKAGAYRAGRAWLILKFNDDYLSRQMIGKTTEQFCGGYHHFRVVPTVIQA